jgi:uncharacterized membrane protein
MKNVNEEHKDRLTLQDKIAVWITNLVGTMGFFYFCIILVTIPLFYTQTLAVIQYISSGYLQLILLPIILVGQALQTKHAELRADADYETNIKAEAEIKELMVRLNKIDTEKLDKIIELLNK